jgi:hypothetical protein
MKKHGFIIQIYIDIQGYSMDYSPRRLPGGHRIATWLRQHDWDVEVLDFGAYFTLEELQEFAKSRVTKDTVFCAFSCFFGSWTPVLEAFAQWLKKTYPDLVLFVGGTSYPMIDCPAIDYHVTGFGEHAVLQLLKVVSGNAPRSSLILDPTYLGRKKVLNGNSNYPAFPMKDLNIYYEDRDYLDENEWLTIETARGCIFKCKFCNFPILGVKEDYTRDADDFYQNLQQTYDQYGVRNYYIADETFNDYVPKLKKFADAVERMSFVPFFASYARADLLISRPEDREHMLRMNCLAHHMGIESTNPETLKVVGKGMHPDRLLPGLIDVRKYFETHGRKIYRSTLSLIAGLPHETLHSMHRTRRWLEQNWKGHHCVWFTLEIPLKKEGSGLLSEFSINPEKYGYSKYEGSWANRSRLVAEDLWPWQNEHMNQAQAHRFLKHFNDQNPDFSTQAAPFGLHFLCSPGYGIDEVLSNPETPEVHKAATQFGIQLVARYKQLKLK